MNREIKFRAWDGYEMRYEFVVARPQSADCLSIMTDQSFAEIVYGLKRWKVMQFTGLMDRNGKEIYEGDIIKYKFTTQDITDNGEDVVAYLPVNCGFYPFTMINYCEDGYYSFLMEDIEVIGNIYETNGKD